MADVFSPQVVTREIDVSTVAPSVSSSIAAIVGGATKGALDTPTFITTPNEFVDTFGEPITTSFLGYTAINYLRQGNQLWVTRVASLAGSDPYATATTNTKASITSESISTFGITETLTLQFDFSDEVAINFAPATSTDITTMIATINAALEASEPKLGVAELSGTNKIKITSQSNAGPNARVVYISADSGGVMEAAFSGKSGVGTRAVTTQSALTAGSVTSNSAATYNTNVTYASIKGNDSISPKKASGTLYNVSKLSQSAYGIFAVADNNFATGTYNSATITLAAQPGAGETITITDTSVSPNVTATFTSTATSPSAGEFQIGATVNETASNLATAINTVDGVNAIDTNAKIPSANVTAVADGADITLTQISPDASKVITLTVGSPNNITLPSPAQLSGGTTGDWFSVEVPTSSDLTTDGVENNAIYYFMANADFTYNTTVSAATSIAAALAAKTAYDSTDVIGFTASSNSNQFTISAASEIITTPTDLQAQH
jgi:hypothetical protein